VKNLDLKPKGKTPFDEFANQKKPQSNREKCALAVYYLGHELGLTDITMNHVFTFFKNMKWRGPADLEGTLYYTASQDGWIDTSDMKSIKTTAMGQNLIEHDLPKTTKKG